MKPILFCLLPVLADGAAQAVGDPPVLPRGVTIAPEGASLTALTTVLLRGDAQQAHCYRF